MEIPKEVQFDAEALAAWRIYLKDAAKELQDLMEASSDAYECIYGSIDTLEKLLNQFPSAIDFGLEVLRKAFRELLESVHHNYGKGPEGAENILKWYLIEFSTFFQGNVPPYGIGAQDTMHSPLPDASNIRFTSREFLESQDAGFEFLEAFQKARLSIIVLLAMEGRCHAMGFARLNRGDARANHIGGAIVVTIYNILDREHAVSPLWSKADLVGCCILLRSCEKSLLEAIPADLRDKILTGWNGGFTAFLYGGDEGKNVDDDFVVKVHAAVSEESR